MLLTLEEISQLVAHSHCPHETLTNIVALIQRRFHTEVCSVYLLEPIHDELILAATLGLRPESIGQVRMRRTEGLTGLVAEQLAPVMVEEACEHPRFKHFPEAGEDLYHSFLGVPLIEGGVLQGVLVVQTTEPREFSPNEIRMLVAVAAQLAPLVGEARLLEWMAAPAHESGTDEPSTNGQRWQGVALSPGQGLGQALIIDDEAGWWVAQDEAPAVPAVEGARLEKALAAAADELRRQSGEIAELVGEEHGAILQAQLMIMEDRAIKDGLLAAVATGQTAEQALAHVLHKYAARFQQWVVPALQDRLFDFKDVFRRIRGHLLKADPGGRTTSRRVVLVAREPSVMDLFAVELERLAGIVVEQGGPQCHAAILARSLGVPMVGQVRGLLGSLAAGRPLLVDGGQGCVHVDPPADVLSAPVAVVEPAPATPPAEAPRSRSRAAPLPRNGSGPQIEANVNLLREVGQALAAGAAGVGLFRSEFLFLGRHTFPNEEEQLALYQKLVARLGGRPINIRTFDLRSDKPSPALAGQPALDWRQLLESAAVQRLFKEQVRAILRAGAGGPVRLLVPFVVRTEQLEFILTIIEQARAELRREGLAFGGNVRVGVMIEVPTAVALIDSWAWQVDFFALGTNDLLAFALGLDRNHPVGSSSNDFLHPGFLRLIYDAVRSAHRAGRKVTACGEMASHPEGGLALAALQVDVLSVAAAQIGDVRRRLAPKLPSELAAELINAKTDKQARELLRPWLGAATANGQNGADTRTPAAPVPAAPQRG